MTLQAAPVVAPVDAASFEAVRPRLFGIAYRTLESAADADDVVQDAWIRWQRTDRDQVRDDGRVSRDDHEAPRAQRRAIRSCPPRDVRPAVASRTGRRPSRSHAGRGATRGARARGAHALGEAVSHRTRRLRPPRGVRLPLPADRTACSRRARRTPGSSSPVPASASPADVAGRSAPPSSSASSTPSSTPHKPEISQRSSTCSRPMSTRAPRSPSRHSCGTARTQQAQSG